MGVDELPPKARQINHGKQFKLSNTIIRPCILPSWDLPHAENKAS